MVFHHSQTSAPQSALWAGLSNQQMGCSERLRRAGEVSTIDQGPILVVVRTGSEVRTLAQSALEMAPSGTWFKCYRCMLRMHLAITRRAP